jgi:predicted XRE-type DNA-binding protein
MAGFAVTIFAVCRSTPRHTSNASLNLAVAINDIIRRQQLSQVAAARRLNVNQPKVSALLKYQLQGFSVERLMRFLTALDRDIEIVIHHKSRARKSGRILVTAA